MKALIPVKFAAAVLTFAISFPTLLTFAIFVATVFTFVALEFAVLIAEILLDTFVTAVAFDATVVTSVALGTSLTKLYVLSVVVVSTNNPKPDAKVTVFPQLFKVTVEFPSVPLAIVITPELLEVIPVDNAVILTIVPAPLLTSGLAFGKLVSFAIGTNPPTSSTKSITLASIAAVVATLLSFDDQVSPDAIVSVESCLKYLESDADVVKTVTSSGVEEA